MAAPTTTDWIKPGATVLVYCKSYGQSPESPRQATVARVAAKSFTLDGITDRIELATQESKRIGGSWTGWTYRVVPVDSDEARDVLARAEKDRLVSQARAAVDRWSQGRTRANRLAAIEALQAIQDDE